ncbi:MAG: coenzyme F420-0:L-glutamate ligase [Methanocorpusculum sp.]|nr:coenzyme F420-0:L-glutamate ligase [Methanocorpusculum sp.]
MSASHSFSVYGLSTPILQPGDDITAAVIEAAANSEAKGFQDGDILVLAESPLATTEGRIVSFDDVEPSRAAHILAAQYHMDKRMAEIVLNECDEIVGGVPGYLLARRGNLYLPNAGIDESNAPAGMVTLLPKDPDASALRVRRELLARLKTDVAVIVVDSRTHAMRLGVSGVAIGVAGILPITDERGKKDLFGHKLHVTRRAIADNLASTAELLMGESNECVPAVLIRGYAYVKAEAAKIESIAPEEDLFLGMMRR